MYINFVLIAVLTSANVKIVLNLINQKIYWLIVAMNKFQIMLKIFLIDYFNASDITNFFLKINFTNEVKNKDPINIVKVYEENKLEPIV